MLLITKLMILIILTWSFINTTSYGVFVWKQKNRFGGICVMLIGLISVLLPVMTLILRG